MLPLPAEHHPRVATVVAAGLLMVVLGVVVTRVAEAALPGLAPLGSLLAIVGVLVFFSAGFLYTALFIRDLLAT